jgi:hypothetical protein
MHSEKRTYTHEELRLALLENDNKGILQELKNINKKIDCLDLKFDRKIDALDKKLDLNLTALDKKLEINIAALDQKINSNFHWLMGSMFGLYATVTGTLLTALAKSLHWF